MAKMGSIREATEPHCIRALLVEFIVTFLFVFTGVASSMAADKVGADPVVGLLGVALTNTLVVTSMISTGHISGGHLNPAVTLGLLIGGHITFFRSILYWIHQLLASAAACYLLHFLTGGLHHLMTTPVHRLGYAEEVIWEIILTFSLLFSVYANMVHPKRGPHGVGGLGPILVGFVVGANILAAAAFSSASMNPARSFGPALVTGNWTHHWVHWVGPLTGGGLAAFIYETFFVNSSYLPLHSDEQN